MQLHVLSRDVLPSTSPPAQMGRLGLGTHGRTVRRVVPGRPRRLDGRHGAAVDRVGPRARRPRSCSGSSRATCSGTAASCCSAAAPADLLGRRRVLLAGLAVFTVGVRVGGLVDDGTLLVITRFLKGAAAAFTAPAGPLDHHHPLRRGPGAQPRAEHLHRDRRERLLARPRGRRAADRARLALDVPAAGADRARAARRWPRASYRATASLTAAGRSFDIPGAVTLTAGDAAARAHRRRGARGRLGRARDDRLVRVAAALLAAFVAIERRASAPLVRLGILRSGPLVRANLGMMTLFGAYVGFQFVMTLYLQAMNGWSPVETALAFLPAGMLVAVGSPRIGPLVDRFGDAARDRRRCRGLGARLRARAAPRRGARIRRRCSCRRCC